MTHHSSSIGFDRFQKILSINQPLHPAPFFSFFLLFFFPFSNFLLISKIFKKKFAAEKKIEFTLEIHIFPIFSYFFLSPK